MFLPALVAKFLSLSAVAQAASGVGIAVVAFTGAGATGLLGTDVQTTLTSAVGAAETTGDATPTASSSAEASETRAAETTETPAVETPAAVSPRTAEAAQSDGPLPGQTFGDWVHEAFPDGKADGRIVSSWARQKHVTQAEVDAVEGVDDATPTATPTPEVETETEHATEATHGHGDTGHGGGNSGHGHN